MTECPQCHRMVDELSIREPCEACSKCVSFCSSPPVCSPDWDRARWHMVTYLSHFLAAQRGIRTPVSEHDKQKAESMTDDMLGWIRENMVLTNTEANMVLTNSEANARLHRTSEAHHNEKG